MAKKTQSATGPRLSHRTKLSRNYLPNSKAGSAHVRAEPSGPEWTFARPSEDSSFRQMCPALGRTA
jgi:hypothetical protein